MSVLVKRLFTSAAAGALLVAAAACADRTTAPAPANSAVTSEVQAADYARGGRMVGALHLDMAVADPVTFTVDPTKGGWFKLAGGHYVYFPANSICDPATSSYGPTHWDESCTAATTPIQVKAVSMQNIFGMPYVDFQPAMRFVPSRYASRWVWLYLYDPKATYDPNYAIYYCFGLACVDESVLDSTLVTHVSTDYPYFYRRVKHFSGYNVAAGRSDTETSSDVLY